MLLNETTHSLAVKISNSGVVVIEWRDWTRFFCAFFKKKVSMI